MKRVLIVAGLHIVVPCLSPRNPCWESETQRLITGVRPALRCVEGVDGLRVTEPDVRGGHAASRQWPA